ncbi:MAG: bacteriocin [Gammaproteobacteria bacterium]|nr:bacteriocin [Gammaproteobacteria bacterium]
MTRKDQEELSAKELSDEDLSQVSGGSFLSKKAPTGDKEQLATGGGETDAEEAEKTKTTSTSDAPTKKG